MSSKSDVWWNQKDSCPGLHLPNSHPSCLIFRLSNSPTLSCLLSHIIQQNIRWQSSMWTDHPTFCGLPAVIQSSSTVALSWAGWRWDRMGFGPAPSAENSRLSHAPCQSIWHLPCWIQVAFYPQVSGTHAWLKPLTWFTFQFSRSFHLPKI